jgi:hypothetical protein
LAWIGFLAFRLDAGLVSCGIGTNIPVFFISLLLLHDKTSMIPAVRPNHSENYFLHPYQYQYTQKAG